MKFVRWLGAFGSGSDLNEAADWEQSQIERQVAAEPLWRGRSFLGHAKIGLVVDHQASRFHAGWLVDAWTEKQDDGTLRPRYAPRSRQGKNSRRLIDFLRLGQPTGKALVDTARLFLTRRSIVLLSSNQQQRSVAFPALPG